MTPSFNFDNGESAPICKSYNCLKSQADNVCDEECNFNECGYDWGDCIYCEDNCTFELFSNFQCDMQCNNEIFNNDNYLCVNSIWDNCSEGCQNDILYNGIFNRECCVFEFYCNGKYNSECNKIYYASYSDIESQKTSEESNPIISLFVSDDACGISKQIFLIGHGTFNLTEDNKCSEVFIINDIAVDTIIRPLYCIENEILGCYEEGEKAIIMVSDVACMKIFNNIIMENIFFSQKNSLNSSCDTCNYCRATDKRFTYDDQENYLTNSTYLSISYCKSFHKVSFIEVFDASSLTLKNVNF